MRAVKSLLSAQGRVSCQIGTHSVVEETQDVWGLRIPPWGGRAHGRLAGDALISLVNSTPWPSENRLMPPTQQLQRPGRAGVMTTPQRVRKHRHSAATRTCSRSRGHDLGRHKCPGHTSSTAQSPPLGPSLTHWREGCPSPPPGTSQDPLALQCSRPLL